jgi:hypothetical protein
MSDLAVVLHDMVAIFGRLDLPYAAMGGIAVRIHGIPRATYDIDVTLAIDRGRLPDLYRELQDLGLTVPEVYLAGWVDRVADMSLIGSTSATCVGGPGSLGSRTGWSSCWRKRKECLTERCCPHSLLVSRLRERGVASGIVRTCFLLQANGWRRDCLLRARKSV